MATHIYRSEAVQEAKANGWVGFGTRLDKDGLWKPHYERGNNAADAIAKAWPGVFSHGEVSWIPGRTDDEDPRRIGLLVARTTLDIIEAQMEIEIDRVYARVFVRIEGVEMLVEPEDGSRWDVFTPKADGSRPTAEAKPSGDRGQPAPTPRRTATSATAPIRNRSDGDSPVKRVWAMADAMPGASRSDVVAACVAAGINKNTAGTQYFHWKKARQTLNPS